MGNWIHEEDMLVEAKQRQESRPGDAGDRGVQPKSITRSDRFNGALVKFKVQV